MTHRSPFTLARFEYERTHVYYLPPDLFATLEAQKPVFLIGSRGTGKTTLLTALNWRQQLTNIDLRRKLARSGRRGYLGLYIRMPDFILATFDNWLKSCDEDSRARIFGFYLDLIWLEDLCEAISDYLVAKIIKAPVSREYEIISSLVSRYPQVLSEREMPGPRTFKEVARMLERKRQIVERFARDEGSKQALFDLVPSGQIGELGRQIATTLLPFCEKYGAPIPDWQFKICLDESECLSVFQQRVLNTVVRLSRYPITFVISYVRPMDDMTGTLLPSITLSGADKEPIYLDQFTDLEFARFSSGVSAVRIEKQLNKKRVVFKPERILGNLDINGLLFTMLKSSESKKAKDLLSDAKELAQKPFYKEHRTEINENSQSPPIYQAYLVSQREIDLPQPTSERWRKRAKDSAEIRKRMVAAYLCICKELNQSVRYASAEMVQQLSDKCIRDYLLQMHEIFVEMRQSISHFLRSKVPVYSQDVALKRASQKKKDFLPRSGVGSPRETELLIDGLAVLTERLQAEGSKRQQQVLASPERGIFVLETTPKLRELSQGAAAPQLADALRIVGEASDTGYLRLIEKTDEKWRFRVHCSLAASYGFSYRGAYYNTPIRLRELIRLLEVNAGKRASVLQGITERLAGDVPESLDLFEDQ